MIQYLYRDSFVNKSKSYFSKIGRSLGNVRLSKSFFFSENVELKGVEERKKERKKPQTGFRVNKMQSVCYLEHCHGKKCETKNENGMRCESLFQKLNNSMI